MSRIIKYARATIKTAGPVIVGGRGFHRLADISTSFDGERLVITMSALKGVLKDALNFYATEDLVKKATGSVPDDEPQVFEESKVLFQDFSCDIYELDIRTRIKVERMTRTAESGGLFTAATIPIGTTFEGNIFFKEGLSDDEITKIIEILNNHKHKIGASKTAGFGSIEFRVDEPEEVEVRRLPPGFYKVYFKPLTPFVSTKYGNQTLEKRYLLESQPQISGDAMKSVLNVERATFFYPTDIKSSDIESLVNPKYYYSYKYEENSKENLLFDLLKARFNKQAFLLEKSGKRLERAKGTKVKRVYNFHIKRNFMVNTVETFWVQQAYKPEYIVGYVYSSSELEIPEFISIGGARGKGYGLMKFDSKEEIADEPEVIENYIEKFNRKLSKYVDIGDEKYVPLLILTPTIVKNTDELFKTIKPVFEFCDIQNFRYYNQQTSKTHIVKAISPGSFILFKIIDSENCISEILEKRKTGLGELTEKGCGAFEIIETNKWG
ncbi:MAG: superfamily [Thermotogaceae bacterium]|jgi:hypothetical protein|nr:superfamily [Thermotogaceae bacterium]MDN5338583.1 superfamily [Thermotogaceae bacterium]